MGNKCDNSHGSGSRPLGNKAGNIHSTFSGGVALDQSSSSWNSWAGDRDTSAGNSRRLSGGSHANSAPSAPRGSSISELANVNGRSSKKDGQRYGGSPALSASTKGPAGIRSKKGKLK